MAPFKKIRTYGKFNTTRLNKSHSTEVFDKLLARNIVQRYQNSTNNNSIHTGNNSSNNTANNTFDNLLKGKVYNSIRLEYDPLSTSVFNSDSELSKNKSITKDNSTYSPIITRHRRKNKLILKEISDPTTSVESVEKSVDPVIQENTTKSQSLINVSLVVEVDKGNRTSDKFAPELALSYINLPRIDEADISEIPQVREVRALNTSMVSSLEPIGTTFGSNLMLSSTPKPKQLVSSTPYLNARKKELVVGSNNYMSFVSTPIEKEDLLLKTFNEISNWERSRPTVESFNTPKKPVAKPIVHKRNKTKIPLLKAKAKLKASRKHAPPRQQQKRDYKLYVNPIVVLTHCRDPKLDVNPKVLLSPLSPSQLQSGFTWKDIDYSVNCHRKLKEITETALKKTNFEDKIHKSNISSPTLSENETDSNSSSSFRYNFRQRKNITANNSSCVNDSVKVYDKEIVVRLSQNDMFLNVNSKKRSNDCVKTKKSKEKSMQKTPNQSLENLNNERSNDNLEMGKKTDDIDLLDKCSPIINSSKNKILRSFSPLKSINKSTSFQIPNETKSEDDIVLVISSDESDINEENILESSVLEKTWNEAQFLAPPTINFRRRHTPRGKKTNVPLPSTSPPKNNDSCLDKILLESVVSLSESRFSPDEDVIDSSLKENAPPPSIAPPLMRLQKPKKQVPIKTVVDKVLVSLKSSPKCCIKEKSNAKDLFPTPGKCYRRSLINIKRNSSIYGGSNFKRPVSPLMECISEKEDTLYDHTPRFSIRIVPATPKTIVRSKKNSTRLSILENYAATSNASYVVQKHQQQGINDTLLENNLRNLSLNVLIRNQKQPLDQILPIVTAKDIVLRRCGQTEPIPFEKCYTPSILQNCQKIGEGVYGEVFLFRDPHGGTTVMKVIPIEGDLIVNDEHQKKYEEIISEIIISMELSNLRNTKKNNTTCFAEVKKVRCVKGKYPERLLELWDLYDENKRSENDSPEIFNDDQCYIVLELANGGRDLESYQFVNSLQMLQLFKQLACALAVAESELQFEHRDLHWGNVLISPCDKYKTVIFRIDGREIEVPTHGVEIAIIDFTLSRIEHDGVVIYNDLSNDNDLFSSKGDYQFDIYRLMQKQNGNMWEHFEPYSNVLWLHYILDKAVAQKAGVRYKYTQSKIHKDNILKLKQLKDNMLNYKSVVEFVGDFNNL